MPKVQGTPAKQASKSWKLGRRVLIAGGTTLFVAGHRPAQAQSRTLRIASIAMTNSPWHFAMNKFRDEVAQRTNGSLKVQVFMDGQLGDMGQMESGMQLGVLDMAYIGATTPMNLKGAEILNMCYVPYIFSSVASAEEICNNEEFQAIYEKVAKATGIHVVGAWGQRSPRSFNTNHGPIMTPADARGLRMRIPNSDVVQAAFETLGVQVVPMGMLEIYTAISRGTVDGQDNGFDLSVPAHFYEVAKYWSATDHIYELVGWFMSERTWQKLSADERTAVNAAAKEGGKVTTDLTKKLDADSMEILKANHCTYTVPDRDKFREVLANSHKKFDGKYWPTGMVERIRKLSFG
jgi:tripartite ATP-independent transporter DctP family solute receptor